MSGENHRQDDDDFLDEDFVVEDIASTEDLEGLFDDPTPPRPQRGAERVPQDADDLLFTDHTPHLSGPEQFGGRAQFGEEVDGEWNGEGLELEDLGETAGVGAGGSEIEDPILQTARESFAAELGSMLQDGEEDFALDSDQELELVEGGGVTRDDGIQEFEQSGPFVLDDGEGLWQSDEGTGSDGADYGVPAEAVDAGGTVEEEEVELEPLEPLETLAEGDEIGDEAPAEAGMSLGLRDAAGSESTDDVDWEPLPNRSFDDLSEVDEVQRTDEPSFEPVAQEWTEEELQEVDGHDIYADDEGEPEAVVVGGPIAHRGRMRSLLMSLAASLLLLVGTAAVVMRPEWFGLRIEPERLDRAEVRRPVVAIEVFEPRLVAAGVPEPTANDTAGPSGAPPGHGAGGNGSAAEPVPVPGGLDPNSAEAGAGSTEQPATEPVETQAAPILVQAPIIGGPESPSANGDADQPEPSAPPPSEVAVTAPAGSDPLAGGSGEQGGAELPTPAGQADAGHPTGTSPASAEEPTVIEVPTPVAVAPTADSTPDWPVADAEPPTTAGATRSSATPTVDQPTLDRFGDGILVGELTTPGSRGGASGVAPGSRAFAQLHNGNYFIGRVKSVQESSITLRVEEGEVTLRNDDVARLTELGSADYEELQKATRGFIRLTNNNRLVGGILSRIADDHVVIEFRSNRVMLPRSAVGQIVSGEGDDAIRIDTTHEEDDWLRDIAERELGSGKPAVVEPDAGATGPARSQPPR